jgi:glucose-6-phosphate 1-dehydrogenase
LLRRRDDDRDCGQLSQGKDAYRVDHVFGMETTQRFAAMRRANTVIEELWNGEHVEQVEVFWEETLALEAVPVTTTTPGR